MADENPTDSAASCLDSYSARQARNQRVVLSFLLDEHPAQLTIPEVARALYLHPGDFKENDAVERAIRELVGAGLLHCQVGFVLPTRAAISFARLELD